MTLGAWHHVVWSPTSRWVPLRQSQSGFDKKKPGKAGSVRCSQRLQIGKNDMVTTCVWQHGGYAFAAENRTGDQVRLMCPRSCRASGLGGDSQEPALRHFPLWGPEWRAGRAGRERIYLDRFWTRGLGTPRGFTEGLAEHYAKLYAQRADAFRFDVFSSTLRPGTTIDTNRVPGEASYACGGWRWGGEKYKSSA